MEDLWFYLLVMFLMLLGVIMCDELNDRFKRIPFGPTRIPILGNLHELYFHDRHYPYKALSSLAARHGSTMKLWFGFVGSVVASGYERVNHILRSEEWVGEQDPIWILDRTVKNTANHRSTATENADTIRSWASARMYANQALKDLGFSEHATLDSLMQRKCKDLGGLIQYWREQHGDKMEMGNGFFLPFALGCNWTLATGDTARLDEHPTLQELLKLMRVWEQVTTATSKYLNNWPSLANLAPKQVGYDKLVEVNQKIKKLLQSVIQDHRVRGNYRRSPKNLIEKFLVKIDESEQTIGAKPYSGNVPFTDDTLIAVLFNILFPSTLVLESILSFAMFYLSRNPDVQQSLRSEANEKIGHQTNKPLSMDDLIKMPRLSAFLLEVYRAGNVIPTEKRRMLKTVREGDTRVTRGMSLVLNYDSVNFDKTVWSEPEKFQPDRFLDSRTRHSTTVINEDKLLALTAAKRLCVGEMMTKPVLMHTITSLLQQFSFTMTKGKAGEVEKNPQWGIINKPPPYELVIGNATSA